MSFQPVVPVSGFGGWTFLNRTLDTQVESFRKAPAMQRDTAYFRENIARVESAADLVADRRLLRVALGAFGLEDDINSRAFIRRILEDGTEARDALANRLADKRYLQLAQTFTFGTSDGPATQSEGFADRITAAYQGRQFEIAVGKRDDNLRLALNMRRELAAIAAEDRGERAKWFSILGSPPLRQVFETAFGLPGSFAGIDLDQQLSVVQRRTQRMFGESSVNQFAEPEKIEELAQRFLLRADTQSMLNGLSISGGAVALQLLQAGQGGAPLR
ncbi:DUF1217 domain-containing protein [Alkalilacustris brevis]|uniref:DUF1217 domain-containing protein n=1 Tax=Alkalilacustris brevis TaxID=2026338 RepID=UPI000E0D9E72|nr:DUF1217 domain-containing protein [Alkalilacustris brevis]